MQLLNILFADFAQIHRKARDSINGAGPMANYQLQWSTKSGHAEVTWFTMYISARNFAGSSWILHNSKVFLSVYSKLPPSSISIKLIIFKFEMRLLDSHHWQAYDRDRRQTRPYFPALYNALLSSLSSFPQTATTIFPLQSNQWQSAFYSLRLCPHSSTLWLNVNGRGPRPPTHRMSSLMHAFCWSSLSNCNR